MSDRAGEDRVQAALARWRALPADDPWREDIEVVYARLRAVEGISEGRRVTLLEVRAQQVEDWKRAEQAEATVRSLAEHGARNQEVRTLRRRISEIAQRNHALTKILGEAAYAVRRAVIFGVPNTEWFVSVSNDCDAILLAPQPGPEEEE